MIEEEAIATYNSSRVVVAVVIVVDCTSSI
jgi:hypothetical protein